eukprot:1498911-Pleurochrysis_carterae.AAC.2
MQRRWRKLEGSDPATFELVQKIHILQKRLIEKSDEVVDKEMLIKHKEKLYFELKNILARQPGPEVAEQLSVYQASLQEREKQMEQMGAELTLYQTQARSFSRIVVQSCHAHAESLSDGQTLEYALNARLAQRHLIQCDHALTLPASRARNFKTALLLSLLFTAQVSEYKQEISRINKELKEVKRKYFEQKKREQAMQETRRAERQPAIDSFVQESRATLQRFTGGGFNLNQPAS